MSPVDEPLPPADAGPGLRVVGLRFAELRARVVFVCPTAADGLLRALTHAIDAPVMADAAMVMVRRRVDDIAELAWWERAAPLRVQLAHVLGSGVRRVVHASVVGDARGGLALVGPRASGKTTAALAAVHGGLRFVADDYVLLRGGPPLETRPSLETVCLYSTASVRSGAEEGTKRVVDVDSVRPDALRRSLPLRAVAVARVSGGKTRWRRVAAAAALRAWAPSTVRLMADDRGAALPLLAAAVRSLPCYSLDVGDDESEIAAAVGEMLDAAGSRS